MVLREQRRLGELDGRLRICYLASTGMVSKALADEAQPQVWAGRASRESWRFPDISGFAGQAEVKQRMMI